MRKVILDLCMPSAQPTPFLLFCEHKFVYAYMGLGQWFH